ncbi:hypothetical protein QFC22_001223 [Naganishia vaughanmartiniae]|uniref:Uncharacterized protein n=1 Tax=Naganishia vaughanmartiniae TaxID=1424756 RepID=A0ACC2XHX0_9TREE|nr:hypothetical protein QFC22_001223 [Naganishia vaughanmartiniae]
MTALLPTVDPSQLLHALDFASKGLVHPTFLDYKPSNGKEARLLVRALYNGPRPGWPVFDREAIRALGSRSGNEDTATTLFSGETDERSDQDEKTGKAVPICLSETNPVYPISVIVNIALASQPSACGALFRNIHVHSQLYSNGYRPFHLPVASWRTAEGIWVITKDEPSVRLRNWWEVHVRPRLEESESRYKIWSWRRNGISNEASAKDLAVQQHVESPAAAISAVQMRDNEQDSMIIDRGWLPAVEILIQMADILLFFSVMPERPYNPRSSMPSHPQATSLELVHLAEVVHLPGYENGRRLTHTQSNHEVEEDQWQTIGDDDSGALRNVMDETAVLRHLRFIAPEMISSRNAVGPVADIFSWGAAASELINGRGDTATLSTDDTDGREFYSTVYQHTIRPLPPLSNFHPSMTPELAEIVQRAVSLDPEARYHDCSSLLYDLNKVKQICEGTLRGKARADFTVGQIDLQSRFAMPPGLLDREKEFAVLEEAYQSVKSTGRSQVACSWGISGMGKSKLLELWARQKESDNAGQDCFISWAKMDQHLVKPLSAFISVFCSLLERVFSDPLESAAVWRQHILDSLAVNANIFLALLPKEWRAILLDGQESEEMGSDMTTGIDWESWVKQFRTWSYGLLRLFASESRPLTDTPPVIAPLHPRYMIQARPFTEGALGTLVRDSFHLGIGALQLPEPWPRFVSALLKSTQGNPFDIKWKLATMVRNSDIRYNFGQQKWEADAGLLDAETEFDAGAFAANMFHSISPQARSMLCHLACLPSRGIEISLLASLIGKGEDSVQMLLGECIALGGIVIYNDRVQFVHDKPHAAVLASISEDRKPKLFAAIGRALEGISTDYHFVQADMFLSAYIADHALLDCLEVVRAVVRAARAAAASGALDLSSSYLDRTCAIWPYYKPAAWTQDSELALELLTVTAEVTLGRRTALQHISKIEMALQHIPMPCDQLHGMIWLFRLELSAAGAATALRTFSRALQLLGYNTTARRLEHQPVPSNVEHILALRDAPHPLQTNEARAAMALADFMGIAGPTIYSFIEADERFRIFQFVIPIFLHNHAATKHPTTAYTWYLYAILLGNDDISRLKTARAWIELADSYTVIDGPIKAAVETLRATVGYIMTQDLEKIDYTHAGELCLTSYNYDIMSYVLGLNLATKTLSGKGIAKMFRSGRSTLQTAETYLQPTSRLMSVPFLQLISSAYRFLFSFYQFGANLTDTNMIPKDRDGVLSWSILEGDFMTSQDILAVPHTAPLYALVYGLSSLFLGLLFRVPSDELRKRALVVSESASGGTGTILKPFSSILLGIVRLMEDEPAAGDMLQTIYNWLDAFPLNRDFQAIRKMLQALETVQRHRDTLPESGGWLFMAEEAIDALEGAESYLFTEPEDESPSQYSDSWGDLRSTGKTESTNVTDAKARKLDLEKILRGFLLMASERDSSGLVRRVLQVLLQVTCTHYACFATEDPATGLSRLRGFGTYDIQVCDKSFVEAKDVAPTVLLSHAIITKKPVTSDIVNSLENGNLVAREPFFTNNGPPRSFLLLPLFVQGKLSGVIYLSSNVPSSRLFTSQVGLLATFAAIILRSNESRKTLESAVRIRTQQLEQALHSRSTFISGVSHEIRTPLFAINGLCSVMESSNDLSDSQRENLHVISQSANDLQRIVTDVLDWSKLDAGSITPESIPFDLRRIIENALETVAHLARSKNITLLLENSVATDPSVSLKGDPHRYRQCLLNLLSNAIKFTAPTTRNHASTVTISWSWQDRGEKLEITCAVKDEGIGIPAKSMHKLFQSFSQVDSGISRNFGGTGLGLSITRGLAKMLGGTCWSESVEGQGSTFYLLVQVDKDTLSQSPVQRHYPTGSPQRALIYAPKTSATSVLQANLDTFGVRNTLCDRQSPHIQQLERIDLVIMDVDDSPSPEETLQELKRRHSGSKASNLQFIILVSLTDMDKVAGLVKNDTVVTKPIKAQSLYNATRSCSDANGRATLKASKKASGMDSNYVKMYPLKICYIDDSKVNVAVGKKILSKFGYKDVDVCYDGQQAVSAAQVKHYDLMLMDLQVSIACRCRTIWQNADPHTLLQTQMPNMDGHTAKRLIAEDPNTGDPYVVALTANSDQETKDRCMVEEHFQGFLSKPLTISA